MEIEGIIKIIFQLFDDFGQENYIGEEVTQLQHAQQCAQQAKECQQSNHVILGAFLHDVGHLIGMFQMLKITFSAFSES